MAWTVEISDVAEKQLHRLDRFVQKRLLDWLMIPSKGVRTRIISARCYLAIYLGFGGTGSVIIALSARSTMTGWSSWP